VDEKEKIALDRKIKLKSLNACGMCAYGKLDREKGWIHMKCLKHMIAVSAVNVCKDFNGDNLPEGKEAELEHIYDSQKPRP